MNSGNTIDIKDIEVGRIVHATDDVTCGDTLDSPLHKLSKKIEKSVMPIMSVSEATEETCNFVYRDEDNRIKVVDKTEGETSYVWAPISDVSEIVSGNEYLMVNEQYSMIFDGSLEFITGATNNKSVTITDRTIPYNTETLDSSFIFTKDNDNHYTIKSRKHGYYIGQNAKNKVVQIDTFPTSETEIVKYTHTIVIDSNILKVSTINTQFLSYYIQYNNSASKFAYYSSAQKPIIIYKKVEIAGKTTYEWRTLVKEGDIKIDSISNEWLDQHLVPSNN